MRRLSMDKFLRAASTQQRPGFKLGACRRCGGDAFFDPADAGEWRCLQCARPLSTEAGDYPRESIGALVTDRRPNTRVFAH